jgi:hypothetical protein
MDAQFWIYIVIGVLYFLSRFFKKPEQGAEEAPKSQQPERRRPVRTEQTATEEPRPLTFEELLREITEGKQAQKRQPMPEPEPEHEPVPRYEPYEQAMGEEARSFEDVRTDEVESARKWKPYEQVIQEAPERRSLEETLRLQDTVVSFGKFAAFDKKQDQKKILNDYIKIIRNPESLKQAVVMSEILRRKF